MFFYVYSALRNILDIIQYEFDDTRIGECFIIPIRETMEIWWNSEDGCIYALILVYIVIFLVCVYGQRIYNNQMALGSNENRKQEHRVNRSPQMIIHALLLNLATVKNLIVKEKILELTRVRLLNVSNGLKKRRYLKDYRHRINNANHHLKKVELLDDVQERLDKLCRIAEKDKHLKLVQQYLKELSRFLQEVRLARTGRTRLPNLLEPLALIRCEITTLVKMLTVYDEERVTPCLSAKQNLQVPAPEEKPTTEYDTNSQSLQTQDPVRFRDRCCHTANTYSKEQDAMFNIVVKDDDSTSQQEEAIMDDNTSAEEIPSSSGGSRTTSSETSSESPIHHLLNAISSTNHVCYKTASAIMDDSAHGHHGNAIKFFSDEEYNNKSSINSSGYYKNISSSSENDNPSSSSEDKGQTSSIETVSECSFVRNKIKQIEASNFNKTCEIDTNKSNENAEKNNSNALILPNLGLHGINNQCHNILKDNLNQ